MRTHVRLILFLLSLILAMGIKAQVNVRDSAISTPLMYGVYGFHFLAGDIADMYGPSSTIGAGLGYKLKNNIYFGLEYSYLFGGKVQNGDEVLQYILTDDGQLIGQGGEYAIFQFMQRGHIIWAQLGKVFPVFGPNPNSGILIKVGAGFTQHRMDISVQENTAPQVKDDYKYGYDRLTRGVGLNQFIGYQYLGDSRIWNFYGGLDFSQAWTKNVRDLNFDTRQKDNTQHLDLYFGFKVGWIIPMYRQAQTGYYY